MMKYELTAGQKDVLQQFATSNSTEVPAVQSDDIRALQGMGLIWKDGKTVTDRGMAVAIVNLNVPYSQVSKAKWSLASYTKTERTMYSKIFPADEEIDQLFYARFKVMLDHDMFTQNQAFRDPRPDDGYKMTNLVFLELAEKSKLEVPKMLKMMRIPNADFIKSREDLVAILKQAQKMAGWS